MRDASLSSQTRAKEMHLQERLEHPVAPQGHRLEVDTKQAIDKLRVSPVVRAHTHGALKHPSCTQTWVVRIDSAQRLLIQSLCLQTSQCASTCVHYSIQANTSQPVIHHSLSSCSVLEQILTMSASYVPDSWRKDFKVMCIEVGHWTVVQIMCLIAHLPDAHPSSHHLLQFCCVLALSNRG